MRKLLLSLITALAFSATAQEKRTLYYSNSKKAFEGTWTYVNTGFYSGVLRYVVGMEPTEERQENNTREQDEKARLWGALQNIAHFMKCEGLITTYFHSGGKQAEITFKDGIPHGPIRRYNPAGKLMAQGMLKDGMPDGEWKMYYSNGTPYMTGTYQPYSQDEIHDHWQLQLKNRFMGAEGPGKLHDDPYNADPNTDEAQAIFPIRKRFNWYANNVGNAGRKVGPFIFYHDNGKRAAELVYKANVRDGLWSLWDRDGKLHHQLLYKNGQLVSVSGGEAGLEPLSVWAARHRLMQDSLQRVEDSIQKVYKMDSPIPDKNATSRVPPGYTIVDAQPEFPGIIREYLAKNLRYPQAAKAAGIEGRVIVRFTVEKDGTITNARVHRGIGGGCDEEALRLVYNMPRWKPGYLNGQPVSTDFSLPIKFPQDEKQ